MEYNFGEVKYKKSIIVINGKGGSGKDTLIKYFMEYSGLRCINISSIDPIKQLLISIENWDGVTKTNEIRKKLSDLKAQHPEIVKDWLEKYLKYFKSNNDDIMFVHIREPKEIDNFINYVKRNYEFPAISVLVKSNRTDDNYYGNTSDDDVEKYEYDFEYMNNDEIELSCKKFICFMKGLICDDNF